jgi:protein-S-isoprenylcysteine O-methyltransferase Ste14
MSADPQPRDASSRWPWPPTIFTAAFAAAWWLQRNWPLPTGPESVQSLLQAAGWCILAAAIALALVAEIQFLLARTATLPTSSTSAIVTTGVYAFTRNPMYLAMSLALAGAALAFGSLWYALALPFAVFGVIKLAIEREEIYLERKFGAPYLAYKNRVRRWL